MLSVIAFFATALTPVCPVPAAPADAVVISATKTTLEAAGGAYVAGNGWPAPGEAQVGSIATNGVLRCDRTIPASPTLTCPLV
jgi:hypothetical protein